MTTCSKCGAENKPSADVCRMCGTPLLVSTPGAGASSHSAAGGNPSSPSEITCPNCKTVNESDWSFCQQCGTNLHEAPASPVVPVAPPPAQQQEQATVVVPSVNPPNLERGLKTVASHVPETKIKAAPEEPPPPQPPPPQAPPKAPSGMETVLDRTPMSEPRASASGTEVVRSESPPAGIENGMPCPQCGRLNSGDSAFCATCGASIRIAKTIVMASVPAPPPVKGRLHLIMEGGQAGDSYDLKDETAVGRTTGDITFPHDGFMSGRHARIVRRGSSFVLVDEDSRNGTFIRINGEVELKPGDMILIGRQLFRFEI
jgi:RNA polymerase subunit RPABC4/transcription elongation factor Spt4